MKNIMYFLCLSKKKSNFIITIQESWRSNISFELIIHEKNKR